MRKINYVIFYYVARGRSMLVILHSHDEISRTARELELTYR
jgi:hypothetical protein